MQKINARRPSLGAILLLGENDGGLIEEVKSLANVFVSLNKPWLILLMVISPAISPVPLSLPVSAVVPLTMGASVEDTVAQ